MGDSGQGGGNEEYQSVDDALARLASLQSELETVKESTALAALHMRLGHHLRNNFLHGVAALKHYQEAFRLDSSRLDALGVSRELYREMGRFSLVQKLLNLELAADASAEARGDLYRELGQVLADQGDLENAAVAFAEALQAGIDTSEVLAVSQVSEGEAADLIRELLDEVETVDVERKVELLLRAVGVAKRFAFDSALSLLEQAYRLAPQSERVAALYEGHFLSEDNFDDLIALQNELVDLAQNAIELSFIFGARWARRQQPESAAPFLQRALLQNPDYRPAIGFLQSVGNEYPEHHERLVAVAERVARQENPSFSITYLLASAGLIAWRSRGETEKAKTIFSKLKEVAPDHVALKEFEARGQEESTVESESIEEMSQMDETSQDSAEELESQTGEEPVAISEEQYAGEDAVVSEKQESSQDEGDALVEESTEEAAAVEVDEALVEELSQKLAEVEKRPHEYVKTLVALGDALGDKSEKANRYREAAELYSGKFGNHAESVKAYQKLLSVAPADQEAKAYLREMYEKRRDWDNLLDLLKSEADELPEGEEKTQAYRDIATLATERMKKKPDICVGLWQVVLDNDPRDEAALKALVQLHERGRNYEELCGVLNAVVGVTLDEEERVAYLTKLGQIAGDRLKDDERAAEAYRELLQLRPDDRRAQEQLKKRYVALGRWADLEDFYQGSGNWDEFIRLLESNEGKAESSEQRIEMLQKVAELWLTQKGKPDRAARALEKILSIDEQNLAAADQLISIYENSNNAKGLVKAIDVKLGHLDEPVERLALLTQAAVLYEEKLRDKNAALEHYLQAVALDPSNQETLDAAERVAGAADGWPQLVEAYQAAVGELTDPEAEVSLRLRLGRLLAEQVENIDEALLVYRGVYDDYPENREALSALESLYATAERFGDLLEVYHKKLELVSDPQERKETQFGIARVQQDKLEDIAGAISTYEEVIAEDPGDGTALAALDALYGATEAWDEQVRTISQRIDCTDSDQELIELKFRLAQVQQEQLAEPALALENYREVLLLDMNHAGARAALEALLETEELRASAAAILETVFEQQDDAEKLVSVLAVRAQSSEDLGDKVELLRKLALVASERLNSNQRAFQAQAEALSLAPVDEGCREELEQYAEAGELHAQLAQVYAEIATEAAEPSLAYAYSMRLAALQERSENVDAAAEAYAKALEADAASEEALMALDSLLRGAERWEGLVENYGKRIELSLDPQSNERLYAEMAGVLEEKLGRPADAVVAYQQVLVEQPSSTLALTSLAKLFTQLERWDDLAANLEAQLVLAETEAETITLTLQLAELREARMGQVEMAIEAYHDILEREPTEPSALAALERLAQDSTHELAVTEILEPIYRMNGEEQKLIGVLEVQVRRSEDTARQV
ncbi:MAG: hypothetical protein MK135_11555 [Polyangiaceae bacterium]|nr:hypothetical protein [Polyangiaceae bacterium]